MTPLAKSDDPRVRLNVAIIAARVANYANSVALEPVTLTLLADSSDATRLWALKAAQAILPFAASAPAGNGVGGNAAAPLVAAMVKIGKDSHSGAVVQYVYEALTVDPNKVGGNALPNVLSATVPAIHEVLASRIAQYQSGIPEEPLAEGIATIHLTSQAIWNAQPPARQYRTIQLISDLIGVVAQQISSADSDKRQDLITVIRNACKAIQVAGRYGTPPNQALADAGSVNLTSASTPETVVLEVDRVFKALRAIPAYKALTPPPTVSAASSPPATTNAK